MLSSLSSVVFVSKESVIDEAMKELFLSSYDLVGRLDRLFFPKDLQRDLPTPSQLDKSLIEALIEKKAPDFEDSATATELTIWVESMFQSRHLFSDEYDVDSEMLAENTDPWRGELFQTLLDRSGGSVCPSLLSSLLSL